MQRIKSRRVESGERGGTGKMKRLGCALMLLNVAVGGAQTLGQGSLPVRRTLVDDLQTSRPGKGGIVIDQGAGIGNLIGARMYGANVEAGTDGKSYLTFQGYRVQVYAGNDPLHSKEEAFRREKEIKEALGIATYVMYNAPFWRLRVGDFDTQEEAYAAQRRLMSAFPSYGKEMYIVRENLRFPLDGSI